MLYLSLPQQARGMIRLSDVGGQQYFSKNIVQSDMSIDISSLPVGIYILQWQDAQQIYSKKIVVQ
jgi:hypothetical protein